MSSTSDGGGRNGRGGFVGTLIDKLLAYADRPWRAIFILVLVLVLGIGYAVWESRTDLVRVFTTHGPPHPLTLRNDLGVVITGLFYSTTADGVAIWAVDLGANRADLKLARRRGDVAPWDIIPAHLSWVTEQTDPTVAAKLFRGEPACDAPTVLKGVLAAYLATDGMTYICYVPEPPSSTEAAVGVVVLAWRIEPEPGKLRASLAAVQAQTEKIIMR